jgi:hypothetical protein
VIPAAGFFLPLYTRYYTRCMSWARHRQWSVVSRHHRALLLCTPPFLLWAATCKVVGVGAGIEWHYYWMALDALVGHWSVIGRSILRRYSEQQSARQYPSTQLQECYRECWSWPLSSLLSLSLSSRVLSVVSCQRGTDG